MTATNPGDTNLISWWKMNETSGTRYDAHGSNDLTDMNTVTYGAGKQGNAAQFDPANSEYLKNDTPSGLSFGDDSFGIYGWIYFSSLAAAREVINKWNYGSNDREYRFYHSASALRFLVSPDGSSTTYSAAVSYTSTSTWTFFACWHDPVTNKIYLELDFSSSGNANISGGINAGASPLYIGGLPGVSQYMSGRIDEVCYFSPFLTSDEREWLYNGGNGRSYEALTAEEAAFIPKTMIFFDRRLNWNWLKKGGLWMPRNPITA